MTDAKPVWASTRKASQIEDDLARKLAEDVHNATTRHISLCEAVGIDQAGAGANIAFVCLEHAACSMLTTTTMTDEQCGELFRQCVAEHRERHKREEGK